MSGAYLLQPGRVPYLEAWELQRAVAAAVSEGGPDTVVMLEHPPVITLGRRTGEGELHVPEGADVEVVETNRGGKSTYHGPGQLVCYPILDLNRHGRDVKKYCRDLEEALIRTVAAFGESRLGRLWQVLTPLINAGVYFMIFGIILDTRRGMDNFIGYLCIGYPEAELDRPELERADWEHRRPSSDFTIRR